MFETTVTSRKGELTRGGHDQQSADAALATPKRGVALEGLEHLVAPDRPERSTGQRPPSSSQEVASPLTLLIREVSRYRLLSAKEERQVAQAIQISRREFHEALFSFAPVVHRALPLLREATMEGAIHHHSRILQISTVDSKARKKEVVAIARLNVRTIGSLVERCEARWSNPSGFPRECRDRVDQIAGERDKIAVLLSEIPMRPTFFAEFFSHCNEYVDRARALYQRTQEASTPEERRTMGGAFQEHLDSAWDTYDTLVERWERICRAREDYNAAKGILVTRNMRLAISEAKKFSNKGVPLEDLIQEGASGLMTAAEKFDREKGCRFSTYATQWVRQSIYRYLDFSPRTVRLPSFVLSAIRKVDEFGNAFRGRHGRSPTPEEIADGLKGEKMSVAITPDWVRDTYAVSRSTLSLESYDGEGAAGMRMRESILDTGEAPIDTVHNKLRDERRVTDVERVLAENLDARQLQIIRMRFGLDGEEPKTLREIGERLGITRERVRQVELRAMGILEGSDLAKVYGRDIP